MKNLILITCPNFGIHYTTSSFGQQEIKISEVKEHVGDSVKVCTKVFSTRYLKNANGSSTFLNAGGNYPNAPLNIVIWSNVRESFEDAPEKVYAGKEVCITGRIKLFKEKPQMVIYSKDQIVEQLIDILDSKEPQ